MDKPVGPVPDRLWQRVRRTVASKAIGARLIPDLREHSRIRKGRHMFKGLGLSLVLIIGGMLAAPALLLAVV